MKTNRQNRKNMKSQGEKLNENMDSEKIRLMPHRIIELLSFFNISGGIFYVDVFDRPKIYFFESR